MPDMFKGLIWFEGNSRIKNLKKNLVYGGDQQQERSMGRVVPWKEFRSSDVL